MPATIEEVKGAVQESFDGADVTGIEERDNRIFGTIRWIGFKNMELKERNLQISSKVRAKLGLKGLNVGILFPLAPGEKL